MHSNNLLLLLCASIKLEIVLAVSEPLGLLVPSVAPFNQVEHND